MFTNDLGQTIVPGDTVAVITVCTKRVKMLNGTFLGLTSTGKCRVEVQDSAHEYRYEDTGELINWSTYDRSRKAKAHKVPKSRKTTLQLNRIIKV